MKTIFVPVVGGLVAVLPSASQILIPVLSLPLIERLGWTLVHSVWQLAGIAALAAIIERGLKRRAASVRYVTSVSAMTAMLVVPCVTWLMMIDITPRTSMRSDSRESGDQVSSDANRRSHDGDAVIDDAENPDSLRPFKIPARLIPVEGRPDVPLAGASLVPQILESDENHEKSLMEGPTSNTSAAKHFSLVEACRSAVDPWIPLMVTVWFVGVMFCGIRPAWGLWTQWRLRRLGLSPVPDGTQRMLLDLVRRMGISRIVRIALSSRVHIPMVVGYLRPVILIPASVLTGLTPSQLESLLAHELAHVRRHDWLVNALQVVIETVLFYHPAVWWLSNRIRHERELCCDDVALTIIGDKATYGRMLLALEELRHSSAQAMLAAPSSLSATGGNLVQRVRRLLPVKRDAEGASRGWLSGLLVLAGLAIGCGAWFAAHATAENAEKDDTPAIATTEAIVLPQAFDPTSEALRQIATNHVGPQDWPQWCGSSHRNNAPSGVNIPIRWDIETGENVRWNVAHFGGNLTSPVVANGKVYLGGNNRTAALKRYPTNVDLGCLRAYDEKTGTLLWQASHKKLENGKRRDIDWPHIGVCSPPCVQGDRLWYVSNRAEVVCLDTEGFLDGENDGSIVDEPDHEPDDADFVWRVDLFNQLGVTPYQVSASTVTCVGDRCFVITSNGIGEESHTAVNANAPSFVCLDKNTGRILWVDNSPGENILTGSWSSPCAFEIKGETQVVMAGGDGWLYSFAPEGDGNGHAKLLWKFDANPKTSKWILGGANDRVSIQATPVFYDGAVYVGIGNVPENNVGPGRLWCIDPTLRGDVSAELAVAADGKPLPKRRTQAVIPTDGERAIPNPNSAAIWTYTHDNPDPKRKVPLERRMNLTMGNVAIKNDLVFATDFEGIVHCLDAKRSVNGRPVVYWNHDLHSVIWGTPLIVEEKVYIGNEDGNVAIFALSKTKQLIAEQNCLNPIASTPAVANGTLYINTKHHLLALGQKQSEARVSGKVGDAESAGASLEGQAATDVPLSREPQILSWSMLIDATLANDVLTRTQSELPKQGAFRMFLSDSAKLKKVLFDPQSQAHVRADVQPPDVLRVSTSTEDRGFLPSLRMYGIRHPNRPNWTTFANSHSQTNGSYLSFPGRPFELRIDAISLDIDASLRQFKSKQQVVSQPLEYRGEIPIGSALILIGEPKIAEGTESFRWVTVYEAVPKLPERAKQMLRDVTWFKAGIDRIHQALKQAENFNAKATKLEQSLPERWTKRMPNGGRVSLVGISRPKTHPYCWWDADGKPLSSDWMIQQHAFGQVDTMALVCVSDSIGRDPLPPSLGYNPQAGFHFPPLSLKQSFDGVANSRLYLFDLSKPDIEQAEILGVSVADGPWNTLGELQKNEEATFGIADYVIGDTQNYGEMTSFNLGRRYTPELDLRIQLIDKKGQTTSSVASTEAEVTDSREVPQYWQGWTQYEANIKAESIDRFVLESRPRHWTTFTGFATQLAEGNGDSLPTLKTASPTIPSPDLMSRQLTEKLDRILRENYATIFRPEDRNEIIEDFRLFIERNRPANLARDRASLIVRRFDDAFYNFGDNYLSFFPAYRRMKWRLEMALHQKELTGEERNRRDGQIEIIRELIRSIPIQKTRVMRTHGHAIWELETLIDDPWHGWFHEPLTETELALFQSGRKNWNISDTVFAASSFDSIVERIKESTMQDDRNLGTGAPSLDAKIIANLQSDLLRYHTRFNSHEAFYGIRELVIDVTSPKSRRVLDFTKAAVNVPDSVPRDFDSLNRWAKKYELGLLGYEATHHGLVMLRGAKLGLLHVSTWHEADRLTDDELFQAVTDQSLDSILLADHYGPRPESDGYGLPPIGPLLVVKSAAGELGVLHIESVSKNGITAHLRIRPGAKQKKIVAGADSRSERKSSPPNANGDGRVALADKFLDAPVEGNGAAEKPVKTRGPSSSWPSFRHDLNQTGVASSKLPEKLDKLWEVELGGQIVATCAIVGDRVYVPCLSGELFCLEKATGATIWKYKTVDKVAANTFAPGFESSPTVTDDAIYLGDEDGVFHAIERGTGKPRWKFPTGSKIYSSAAVTDGRILFGSYDNNLYCLNMDGTLAWTFATQGYVHCAPAVVEGVTFVAGCDEHLRVIDIATGQQRSEIKLGTPLIASPAVIGDILYVGTYAGEVVAIDWKAESVVWRYEPKGGDSPIHSSAAVTEKLVIVGGRDKLVHGIERANGKPAWTFPTRGMVDSSPVVVGNRVFIGSNDGNLYELNLADGKERWKFNAGKKILAAPAVGEGVLVIGSESSEGKVFCFGMKEAANPNVKPNGRTSRIDPAPSGPAKLAENPIPVIDRPELDRVQGDHVVKYEGIIDDVFERIITFEEGRVVSTDSETQYVKLAGQEEVAIERKELKPGLRVRYELILGRSASKIALVVEGQIDAANETLVLTDAEGDLRSEERRGRETRAEQETRAEREPVLPTVVGTVVAPDGSPIAGMQVLAFKGEEQLKQKFTTDKQGEFQVPKVWRDADSYLTLVARDGSERLGWFDFFLHGHSDSGQQTDDGSFRIILLPMSRTVRGRVVDESDQPLAQIQVQVEQLQHDVNFGAFHWRYQKLDGQSLIRRGITDRDGWFEMKLPIDSSAGLGVVHPDWVGKQIQVAREKVDIPVTKLVRAAKISGSVHNSHTGRPLVGVVMAAQTTESKREGWGEATTDGNGDYVIGGLPAGNFHVLMMKSSFTTLTAEAQTRELESGKTHQADFLLSIGKRLSGRVVDATTNVPIPRCAVNYSGPARPGAAVISTQTNDRGEFEFYVPPGKSHVYVADNRETVPGESLDIDVGIDDDPDPVVLKAGKKQDSNGIKVFIGPPLDRKVSLKFHKAPLNEVLDAACKSAAVTLELDGDGLKALGLTKNVRVSVEVERVRLSEALTEILKPFDKLSFTLDKNRIFVSGREQVEVREKARGELGSETIPEGNGKPAKKKGEGEESGDLRSSERRGRETRAELAHEKAGVEFRPEKELLLQIPKGKTQTLVFDNRVLGISGDDSQIVNVNGFEKSIQTKSIQIEGKSVGLSAVAFKDENGTEFATVIEVTDSNPDESSVIELKPIKLKPRKSPLLKPLKVDRDMTEIVLLKDDLEDFEFEHRLSRVDGHDPTIVEVSQLAPKQLRLHGLSVGKTSMVVTEDPSTTFDKHLKLEIQVVESTPKLYRERILRLFADVEDSDATRKQESPPNDKPKELTKPHAESLDDSVIRHREKQESPKANSDQRKLDGVNQPNTLRNVEPKTARNDDMLDVMGRILKSDGSPAAGARVIVVRLNSGTTSDARQEVRANDDGEYTLRFGRSTETTWSLLALFENESARLVEPIVISAVDDRRTESSKSITLADILLSPGRTITGTVCHAVSRKPVALAKVYSSQGQLVRTNSQGRFELRGIPSDNIEYLIVTSPGKARTRVAIDVSERAIADVDIFLGPGGVVKGRVLDLQGQPIPGAIVSETGGSNMQGAALSETADQEGRFEFEGLAEKSLLLPLRVRARGFHDANDEMFAIRHVDQPQDMTLRAAAVNEVAGPAPLRNNLAADERPSIGAIRGRVLDVEGRPVRNFTVRLLTVKHLEPRDSGSFSSSAGLLFSEDDGRFVIGRLDSDKRYRVAVTAPGIGWAVIEPIFARPNAVLTDREEVEFRLTLPRQLEIHVTDADSKTPISDVMIGLLENHPQRATFDWNYSLNRARTEWTSAVGLAAFPSVNSDEADIFIDHPGYARYHRVWKNKSESSPPKEVGQIEILLQKEARLKIQIKKLGNHGVTGIHAFATSADKSEFFSGLAIKGEPPILELKQLPAGKLTFNVLDANDSEPGTILMTREMELNAGDNSIDIELPVVPN